MWTRFAPPVCVDLIGFEFYRWICLICFKHQSYLVMVEVQESVGDESHLPGNSPDMHAEPKEKLKARKITLQRLEEQYLGLGDKIVLALPEKFFYFSILVYFYFSIFVVIIICGQPSYLAGSEVFLFSELSFS